MHKPLRRRFPMNSYTVNNILDVWEADLVDVQAFSKFNDNYKYFLTVIDVLEILTQRLSEIENGYFRIVSI